MPPSVESQITGRPVEDEPQCPHAGARTRDEGPPPLLTPHEAHHNELGQRPYDGVLRDTELLAELALGRDPGASGDNAGNDAGLWILA